MILAALRGLASLPRLIDAVESLSDHISAQMAQERMENKNEEIEVIIARATARRKQRMLDSEAERILRDSSEE